MEEHKGIIRFGVIAVIFIILLIFGGCTCTKVVETSEVAVVTEFGNVTGSQSEGFHLKAPWQEYHVIKVSQIQVTDTYAVATNDLQSVSATVTAQIQIDPDNAQSLYRSFLGNHIEGIVMPNMASDFKVSTAKYTLEALIQDRGSVQNEMLSNLSKSLETYGIRVISIQISDFTYSDDYRLAVERKVISLQDLETAGNQQEIAKVQAKTNEIMTESLTDEVLSKMIIEKWDGKLPLYIGNDGTGLDILLPQARNPLAGGSNE